MHTTVTEDIREEKTNIAALYPLSPIQGGFFFQSLYEEQSDAYFLQTVLKLTGELHVDVLKQAWVKILDRHECLRASFMWEDLEEPIQIIHKRFDLVWHQEDWSAFSVEQKEEQLNTYIKKDRAQGFNLTQAPLIRFGLFKYNQTEHVLLWSYHHILSDGWSSPIILSELRSIYASLVNDTPILLPNRRSWGDYITWLNQQNEEKAENYWQKILLDVVPTKLSNKNLKEDKSQTYGEYHFSFNQSNSAELLKYAATVAVTTNTVLQALWGILLSVYTGQTDIVYGVTISGRQIDLLGVESMVGIFINTLPLRVQLRGHDTLEEIFQAIQEQMVSMQEHGYIPLWKIQSQQKEGGSGLFDSTYVYQNYPIEEDTDQKSGLAINFVKGVEKMEYTLGITLSYDDGLKARINYRESCFTQARIVEIMNHFEQLIGSVLENPLQRIGELSFLQSAQFTQLELWNKTSKDYPNHKTLPELLQATMEKTPEAPALQYEDQVISYRNLGEQTNQLAHYLRELGVEAEVPVVLAIERSIDMVIGILAVLKAGGTYVPLDVHYPPERFDYMLEDSGAPFIISRSAELEKLSIGQQIIINLDDIKENLEKYSKMTPNITFFPQNLAYIIYTSGSTGRPKGVGISHQSVVAYLSCTKTLYGVNRDQPVLLHGSICFDMSITSLFIPLLTGKLIKIIKEDFSEMLDVNDRKETFSFVKLTPSHLKLIEKSKNYQLNKLSDSFVVGGEAFTGEHLTDRNARFFNEYGPTEATVACSVYELDNTKSYQNVPIGRPLWNTEIYILDKNLNLLPIGVEGEIYIGGVGLARGYINKPGLTADRFIPNPFALGKRLYKTGDRGRYLFDGNIEYLGRIDHQLKLRGFRIELGEIEATLEASAGVQQAVVLCREDIVDQKRLVAYVVPKSREDNALLESLQNLCQSRLPEYMLPNQWVFLESFPLTANGKLDRKALPVPEGRDELGSYEAPKGSIEQQLAQIWSELLGLEVARTHDFFRLGGHSLLAMQMLSRLREALKLEVPLKAIFEHSVLADLASYLESSHLQGSILPAITAVSRTEAQKLSFAQQRLWFIEQLLPNKALYHNPFKLRVLGPLNVRALQAALDAMVARHESLRTIITNVEGIALQSFLPEDTKFALSIGELGTVDADDFIKKPFQFDVEPLCRGLLLKCSEQEAILILVFHHIVIDDWSMSIFWKELNSFYKSYTENKTLSLPELPIQYVDYAIWQRNWLQGDVLEKQLRYWQEQLSDVATLQLPTDYPRPKEFSYQGGVVNKVLSKEALEQLRMFSQLHGVTVFMSLLASIQAFLARYCNQTDIAIGTPIANRRIKETEGLIGFFVNTLVLRNQFEDNLSFETFIKQVESNTLSAYEYQDVPFEQLVEYLQVPRELNRNPLFQVMFNVQHEEEKFQLDNLKIMTEAGTDQLSRFDLLINFLIGSDTLSIRFDYALELFKPETIEKIASSYEIFLNNILRDPAKQLLEIPLLGELEYQKLLALHTGQHAFPEEKNIQQRFEEQVENTPLNIAVIYHEEQITYEELNHRINQLAHYLKEKGVGAEKLVAIALNRSIDMIVGVLGVLKAGGAYVPLDPEYPNDRLEFLLEDTQAFLLITQSSLKNRFEDYQGTLVTIDDEQEKQLICQKAKTNPVSSSFPYHLAYVIYTSGSTGKPKGVMVSHREIVGFTFNNCYLSVDPKTVVLSFSNYVFDGSIFDIFSTLLNSGRLILADKSDVLNAEKLEEIVVRQGVNVAFITTALFVYYAKLKEKNPLHSIRNLLFGGEKINYDDLKVFLETNRLNSNLIHVYGPTENIVFSTYCYLNHDNILQAPIGKKLSDKVLYILDRGMHPVPFGVGGEVYIGGSGLARGYLNRVELTAEKFVPNPFVTQAEVTVGKGLRLYRTGDLAKFLPDGNVEFLGRLDDQVKIRGYRIELGEIETILMQHKAVNQAVVITKEDAGLKQLVAYVTPSANLENSVDKTFVSNLSTEISFNVLTGMAIVELTQNLIQDLTACLPDYMIPAFFVCLDKIPLTVNGKIDKKALPLPDLNVRQIKGEYVLAESVIQQKLVDIWSLVLRIEKIGITDNFFRIGGDSIISIQLVAKARQQGIYFSVKDIFNYPTIAALSLVVNTQEEMTHLKPEQGFVVGNSPLTPIQCWFFEQTHSNIHHYNQASLLQLEQVDMDCLQHSFKILLEQHDALRSRYIKQSDGTWKQTNLASEDLKTLWNVVDLTAVKDEVLPSRIEQEANSIQQSLNIEKGPLIKVAVFNCGKRPARILIVIHHLVVDGVSWRILSEDLEQIYQTILNNKKPLLVKTHSYQQWSYALENYAQSEIFKSQVSYWQTLQACIKTLPVDFDKKALLSVKEIKVSLTEEETTALLQRASKAYQTQINDLLLTALVFAIGDWTKDYSVSLSLEAHGREDVVPGIDLSKTVGWFTSIFPVFLQIENPDNLGQSIKRIKEILREIPDKGIGYGIAKYLMRDHALEKGCEPSISFNYLGQWDNTLVKQGLFSFANESVGNNIAEGNQNPSLLNMNGEVRGGKLQFICGYSTNHYHLSTIEKIAHGFMQRLRQIIAHCCKDNVFGYTPSDFKSISMTQEKLDANFGTIPNIESIYPLSPMQAGLLFQGLYAPDSDAYFVQMVLALTGELQIEALKQAWSKLLERHESLRASFMWESLAEPMQIIHREASLIWHKEDWSTLSTEEQTSHLDTYIEKDRAKRFDFTEVPLARFALFKYGKNKYYLLWSQHHILSDGWSYPIILNELKSIYTSIVNRTSLNLPSRRPYGDYIAWLNRQDLKKAEDYWKHQLAGAIPTRLAKKEIKTEQVQQYGESYLILNETISQKLSDYSGKLGTTLNTVLQTLWGILLSVYTRQSDVVFGVTVSGRQIDLPGVELMVGIFINTLPLRVQLNGFESLETIIRKTQDQMLAMQENAYVPLWKIQPHQKEANGLFDCTYVYQNYPAEVEQSSELAFELVKGIEKMEYKLGINLSYESCLRARINYNKAYFSEDFITKMLGYFEQLILNVVNNPIQKIGELVCLPAKELAQLTVWNDTKNDYPKNKLITELFEASAARVPDAIAIVYQNKQISYGALNEKANQLAHYLQSLGVEPEMPVALAIGRSIEMIIGILGILKAGGVYVPLDVNYPQERLDYMLEDNAAPFVVSRNVELEKLFLGQQIVINLDDIKKIVEQQPKTPPKHGLMPQNLAYIIYTSGSTGRPKGVGISHRSASHLILAQQKAFFYREDTKTLQFASISFDASISEWGCTFAEGSTLVVCDNKDMIDVERTIIDQQVNLMTMPPSVLKGLPADSISKHGHYIVLAGEASDFNLIKTYQENGVNIINAYGPTEGTVCASLAVIENANHIGRPISNTQIHILDAHLNPVPIGVEGEIFIGGIGLARGYLNKPSLTAESFVPNPFGNGERLYKTGDLGKYLPDGNIDFLGRTDYQLKLRGFRIELGEIEETIEISEGVQQAVVLCREDVPGQKRLVAYVVPKNIENTQLPEQMQQICQSRLPDYMQPSQWVLLESLPLTVNGKIDRQALQDREDHFKVKGARLPKNSIESALVDIFKELLNLEEVGIENNFFEMGGNSLLAVSLVLNIKKALGAKVRVADIFENPTIDLLSQIITLANYSDLNSNLGAEDSIFIIQSEGKQKPLFLIHPGLGLSLPYLPLKEFVHDRPIIGLDDPYIGETSSGFNNIAEMADFYLKIIKKIQKTGPYYLAGWSFGGMVAFEMAQQLEEDREVVHSLILIEAANPKLVDSMVFKEENAKLEFEQKVDRNVLLSKTLNPRTVKASISLIKAQAAFSELSAESNQRFQDSKYGWDAHSSNIVEYIIPGEHATIFDKDNVISLGNILKCLLD